MKDEEAIRIMASILSAAGNRLSEKIEFLKKVSFFLQIIW